MEEEIDVSWYRVGPSVEPASRPSAKQDGANNSSENNSSGNSSAVKSEYVRIEGASSAYYSPSADDVGAIM